MEEWKPTIGKWEDEDNYKMKEPLWKVILNAASEYEEVKDAQKVLRWLNNRNLYGDSIIRGII